ncbi:MAG: type IIL restriction-modification enzyme MmeI [Lawsonibacter sp.]
MIVVPAVSSERRKYVPIGFLGKDTIATNLVITIPDATSVPLRYSDFKRHIRHGCALCADG